MKRKSVLFLMLTAVIALLAGAPASALHVRAWGGVLDTLLTDDSIPQDTLIETTRPAAAALKRDTSTMDSLQLAIYKHNKAIDDSLALDSLNRQKKNGIDSPVEFSATDSLIYESGSGMAHLFGDAHVKYQNMDLKSEKIYMCLDSSLVHATGARDSVTGEMVGTPVFQMGSDTYENDTMAFNFKTKKGLIQQVYTEQEDGFLTAEVAKRGANGELFLGHGRYTTCDDPHPDFYLAMSRAKVRPGKDVVFGPTYLVVCDVPLPLAIPYGFFPFTKSYSSGFIMPTYGDETERGFYLRDGGYYFALSDKMDLKLIGEIYTKGSWGISAASNYRKRYKFSGSFYASYQNSVTGEKNMPDYGKQTSFKVQWSHRQDAKANPFSNLSASVNFATSSYERNNLTSMYNPQSMTQSTRTSSVSYSTTFSSIGLNLSTTMNLNQNMRDSTIAMTLPDLNLSISRFYPFKRKKMVGKERWYEKISMSYTGHFSNSITSKESELVHKSLVKDWRNGMQHSIPVSANFTILGYINVNPSVNFTDRTYTNKVMRTWNDVTQREVLDTLNGFYNVYNWNMSLSASTKLYGSYIPSRKLFGNRIDRIRHVLTPQVSLSYAPDFSASRYGYYETYQRTDAQGNVTLVEYSPYQGQLYGVPGKGKTGSISFDLGNNLEMKIRDRNDSLKKTSLIDEFGGSMSYNMSAKTRPWSDLSTRLRLKLTKRYTLNLNAVFASYVYEADSVGATPRISDHKTYWGMGKIGRFQGMSQNFSYTLDNNKVMNVIKWLKGERPEKKKDRDEDDEWDEEDENEVDTNLDRDLERGKHGAERKKSDKADTDEDGYMTYSLPWSLSFGYGITMRENQDRSKFNYQTMRYPYKFTQNLNVSGNVRISDGWNISFSSGYDFENKKISMTTASLSRDLHCFNMSCSVVLAPYTSYNFSFRCNASTLTDALKYDKRSSYSNSVQWY
ncbi:MAG: LPS-assembly protein LptD [Prevotella sp.]|nr:LPS-assembly protein LptD [Prevotella sp.]